MRARPITVPLVAVVSWCAAMACMWRGGRAAVDFYPSLDVADMPLGEQAPLVGASRPPRARRVVLVIVDGLGARASSNLPYLDSLRAHGFAGCATSHLPTLSRPNYVSLLTGVPPRDSGVRTNDYDRAPPFDSILRRVREAGGTTAYVADEARGIGVMFGRDLTDAVYAPWADGLLRAGELAVTRGFTLTIVLPGAVDVAGHEEGAASAAYHAAAVDVDRQLGQILAGVDLGVDAIIITADHGHVAGGGHGGDERDVVEVPLILAGAGVQPGSSASCASLIDVAPTVAALLGLPAPGHALGRAVTGALAVDGAGAASLTLGDAARAARNVAASATGRARAAEEARSGAAGRALTVLLLVFLAALAVAAAHWAGFLRVDRRVLLAALPGFPLALGTVAWAGGASPSSFLSPHSIRFLALSTLAAITIHGLGTLVLLRGYASLLDRLAASSAAAACGLIIAALPLAAMWAIQGDAPLVQLPGPTLLFLLASTRFTFAAYALAVAIPLGVDTLMFVMHVARPLPAIATRQARIEARKPARPAW